MVEQCSSTGLWRRPATGRNPLDDMDSKIDGGSIRSMQNVEVPTELLINPMPRPRSTALLEG